MDVNRLYEIFQRHPKVTKDSRDNVEGGIYFAIRGEQFDGNRFAGAAIEKGAAYAVVDNEAVVPDEDSRYILVENALECLQQLASRHREEIDIPVFALTGSNGKTTTKELIGRVLSRKYRTFVSPGNYNNHIGIPLSILQVDPKQHEMVVLEMGASAQGEIQSYCQYARPDFGMITNIGRAHIEGFGGVEGIVKGKGELFDFLKKNEGVAFYPSDLPHLEGLGKKVDQGFRFFDSKELEVGRNFFSAVCLRSSPSIECEFADGEGKKIRVSSSLMGYYNFRNILAALAVGNYFGVDALAMRAAIEEYRSENNRSQILEKDGVRYLMDAYNANPTSVRAVLENFSKWEGDRKIVILGDMLELGEESFEAHREILDLIGKLDQFDEVYLVGEEFRRADEADIYDHFENVHQIREKVDFHDWRNAKVLLKGSRKLALERLLEKS